MAGCEACEQNLKAELESKDPDDLTESEKAVLEGEGDAPMYYGPLSSWDGDYCEFCHAIGQVGAIVFGVLGFIAVQDFTTVGTGVIAGTAIWVVLAVIVGYVGRFPVLGALLGPIVEKVFALQFGIFLTEKAKKQYGPGIATDGGPRNEPVENRFDFIGSQVHLVASPWGLETCADMDEPGALKRVFTENGQIVDVMDFHPEFNRFRNMQDHVGFRQFNNVCQAHAQREGPTSLIDFAEVVRSNGQEGFN